MKIGFAITTTPKRYNPERDYFELCPKDSICYLHNDVKYIGMATAKNRCIKFLYDAGCDYMILMDDDTKVLKEGFSEFLIKAHDISGIHHFSVQAKGAKKLITKKFGQFNISQYNHGAGVMLFITREVVNKVGYLNVDYPGKWGHSHIGWSIRILKSGLMPGFKGWRVSVDGWEDYFFSEDIQGDEPIQNYTKDQKNKFMQLNVTEHNRENKSRQIYYPFMERQGGVI